jgi:hypothetical protein
MICRAILLGAFAGCLQPSTDEPEIVKVMGPSGSPIAVRVLDDPLSFEATDFRWSFARVPAETAPVVVTASDSFMEFVPYGRGEYWVDRFIVLGVAENVTHRFIVTVSGAPPVAIIEPMMIETGPRQTITLDATRSYSSEGKMLSFEWRNGNALPVPGLPAFGRTFTFITPNAPGEYQVRLLAKEGTLAAEASARIRVTTNAD